MDRRSRLKVLVAGLAVLVLLLPLAAGCGEEAEEEVKVVKLGYPGAYSGAAGTPYKLIVHGSELYLDYINEEDPIPGVKLMVDIYDTKYDPAKTALGYPKLKEDGVVSIMSSDCIVGDMYPPLCERDKIPLLDGCVELGVLDPPSYTFAATASMSQMTHALLEYINYDWDYEAEGRNPRVAGIGWNMSYGKDYIDALEAYHEDYDLDYVLGEVAPIGTMDMSLNCKHAADADADYLIAVTLAGPFSSICRENYINDYGMKIANIYTPLWQLEDAVGSEALEGVVTFSGSAGFQYDCEGTRLMTRLLDEAHPEGWDEYRDPIFLTNIPATQLWVECVRQVVEEQGADAISGETIFQKMLEVEVSGLGLVATPVKYGADARRDPNWGFMGYQYLDGEWYTFAGGAWWGVGH